MAGLRHGFGRNASAPASDSFLCDPSQSGPCIRPRIELTNRRTISARSTTSGRFLAVSTAVLILGAGGVFALHLLSSGGREAVAVAEAPAKPAAASRPPVTIDPRDPTRKVANLLGSPARPAAPAAAPAAPAAAEAGPTADDFARPAFLEPLPPQTLAEDADGPDEDEVVDGAAGNAVMAYAAEPSAAGDVPFPTRRPAQAAAPTNGRETRLVKAINMREAPRRGADTVAVLSAGTKVTLVSCSSWCEIVADGKRGYVYKSAVGR